MKEDLVDSIKSRGYWRINFRPTLHRKDALGSLDECRKLVESSSVEKRGWDYPHIATRNDEQSGAELHDGFVQQWVDWQNHREMWRMYASGQFIHYLALREDWGELDTWASDPAEVLGGRQEVDVVGLNWQVSEIFEFLSRIAKQGAYDHGVEVSLALRGISGRRLGSHSERMRPTASYSTQASEITFTKTFSRERIAEPRELSLEVMAHFFDRFGWNPPKDQLRAMQDELYVLKLGRG